jgi:hypothetical protein
VSRGVADIQDNLAILDVLARHIDPIDGSIDDYMGCVTVVAHPLVHRTNKVWPFRSAWIRHY